MKMNSVLLILSCVFSLTTFASVEQVDVIYGQDNRVEAFERQDLRSQSNAVAAKVSRKKFNIQTLIGYQIQSPTYSQEYRLCSGERFETQPVFADCSGFLVTPDTLMTAGHCVDDMQDCRDSVWVFGYEMSQGGNPREIARENVYECKSIIARSSQGMDYAIIKLDRSTNRAPLKLAPKGHISPPGTEIYMAGYPSGLPLKITDGAQVLKNSGHILATNLDAFSGNSGSPVLNVRTNEVVGILVSGNDDYARSARGCTVDNKLDMSKGAELVTSLNVVPRTFK